MTLMAIGLYNEPAGAYLPSVLFEEAGASGAFFRCVGFLFGNPTPFLAFCPDAREAGRSWGPGHETGVRSALEILAGRDFGDLPLRRTHLDVVGRPDQQAH